jgi:hypothetical protein
VDSANRIDASFITSRILLRNVVWMFDSKGSGNAELGYLEPSDISDYLSPHHDIQRLSNLIPPSHVPQAFQLRRSSTQQVLIELREALFETHGAPPGDTSATMAEHIRMIRDINSFSQFFTVMGISKEKLPKGTGLAAFLRHTIVDSVSVRYSSMPMTQSELYMIRKAKEKDICSGYCQYVMYSAIVFCSVCCPLNKAAAGSTFMTYL